MTTNVDLSGPYPLEEKQVYYRVGSSAGVYLLGKEADATTLTVKYVGRSDDDLCSRLMSWVANGKYKFFMYKNVTTVKAAFEEECNLFHSFPSLDNEIHPAQPARTNYSCPVCGAPDKLAQLGQLFRR